MSEEAEVWIEADDTFPCVPGDVRRLRCFTEQQLAERDRDAHRRGQRDLAAKVEALAEEFRRDAVNADVGASNAAEVNAGVAVCEWEREKFTYRDAERRLRNLLTDAQTPATSHAAGAGAANGASVDDGAETDVAAGREAHSGVTACNYGSHDFVLAAPDEAPIGATSGMHLHVCANCEAAYYEHGAGPCWRCRRVDTETRDWGAGL